VVVKRLMEGGCDTAAGMAMEVEAEASQLSVGFSGSLTPDPAASGVASSTTRRLGLRNSIQTNFGDVYVFQIASWYT
jgi:hypothetical protein